MKPQRHRVHYARKHLRRTDPRRVCRAVGPHLIFHEVSGPFEIPVPMDDETRTISVLAQCRNCRLTIQAWFKVDDPVFGRYDAMSKGRWRTYQYLIEEVPW